MTQTVPTDRLWELLRERSGSQGTLVTLRRDGRPQLSNVNYSFDAGQDVIRVATTADRAKARNLRRDPRAAFHVATPDMFGYVVCEATAQVSPPAADPHDATVDELVEMYRATQDEHEDWEEFRRAKVADARLVLRLAVERVYGFRLPA